MEITNHTGSALPSLPHFPESPLPTRTCNSFPCPGSPPALPTAPLSVQNQTQGLPGTMAISMDSVGLGSNPTSTILGGNRYQEPGIQVNALQRRLASPRYDPSGWAAWHIVAASQSPYPSQICTDHRQALPMFAKGLGADGAGSRGS